MFLSCKCRKGKVRCHLFEVLLEYETWFQLDEVERSTVSGDSNQVQDATKYAMTRYVGTVQCTDGNGLKQQRPIPPFTPTITFINVVSTKTHILDLAVGRSHTHKGQVFKESCTYELKHHLNATSKQQATFSLTYIN
jgi:hypothetical protein